MMEKVTRENTQNNNGGGKKHKRSSGLVPSLFPFFLLCCYLVPGHTRWSSVTRPEHIQLEDICNQVRPTKEAITCKGVGEGFLGTISFSPPISILVPCRPSSSSYKRLGADRSGTCAVYPAGLMMFSRKEKKKREREPTNGHPRKKCKKKKQQDNDNNNNNYHYHYTTTTIIIITTDAVIILSGSLRGI